MLNIGDKAPEFSLLNQNEQTVRLSDYLGKAPLVIYFYPKDDTLGCTAQSCSFRDNYTSFTRLGAEVIGISEDGAASHQHFIAKNSLPFPLLSDVGGAVAKSFGLKKTLGFLPARVTFVLDKHGIVQTVYSSQFNMSKHSEDALAAVERLTRES